MATVRPPIRVLVVDDDQDTRDLLEEMLRLDERFVLCATTASAIDAIHLAGSHQPDAVVLDLHLPGMDGLQALPLLRSVCSAVVVVFSAFPDPITLLDVTAAGADGYVDKLRAWSELLPSVVAAVESVRSSEAAS